MPALNESTKPFAQINRGYNDVFQTNRLGIGLVAPQESYTKSPVPSRILKKRSCTSQRTCSPNSGHKEANHDQENTDYRRH